jgi:hypothetical protein
LNFGSMMPGFKYPPMPKDGAEPKPGVRKGRLWL